MTELLYATLIGGCLGWEIQTLLLWRLKKLTGKEALLWAVGPLALLVLLLVSIARRKDPVPGSTRVEPYSPPQTAPGVREAERVIDERATTVIAAIEEAEKPPEDESLEARVARLTRMQKEIW